MEDSRRASGTTRGSAVNTAGTSVKISHSPAPSAAATATAEASEPPRPSVVTSPAAETPWKPVTSTMAPRSSSSWMRCGSMPVSRALPCAWSVPIPACRPVSDTAFEPSSVTAMAASAHEIDSPTDSSASSSRSGGRAEMP